MKLGEWLEDFLKILLQFILEDIEDTYQRLLCKGIFKLFMLRVYESTWLQLVIKSGTFRLWVQRNDKNTISSKVKTVKSRYDKIVSNAIR